MEKANRAPAGRFHHQIVPAAGVLVAQKTTFGRLEPIACAFPSLSSHPPPLFVMDTRFLRGKHRGLAARDPSPVALPFFVCACHDAQPHSSSEPFGQQESGSQACMRSIALQIWIKNGCKHKCPNGVRAPLDRRTWQLRLCSRGGVCPSVPQDVRTQELNFEGESGQCRPPTLQCRGRFPLFTVESVTLCPCLPQLLAMVPSPFFHRC